MTSACTKTARETGISYALVIRALAVIQVGVIPVFWYANTHLGLSQYAAGMSMSLITVCSFLFVILGPWLNLAGQRHLSQTQRYDKMIVCWICLCLTPRPFFELPWLLFSAHIKSGILQNSLSTYGFMPYFLYGDRRYLNTDTLTYVLEVLAIVFGAFEGYGIYRFFVQGRRFTNPQLGFIMAGMVCEGFEVPIYWGVGIMHKFAEVNQDLPALVLNFFVLNSIYLIMPTLTFIWGMKHVIRQDLHVDYR